MRTQIAVCLLLLSAWLPAAQQVDWEALEPEGYDPVEIYDQLFQRIYGSQSPENVTDEDARGQQFLDAIDKAWREAPLKPVLDGVEIRLAGYGVPLEGDENFVREFLLVPYFGACIHSPPPPRNQIVLVKMTGRGVPLDVALGAMWLEGTLKVSSEDTEYGTAGYTLVGKAAETFLE